MFTRETSGEITSNWFAHKAITTSTSTVSTLVAEELQNTNWFGCEHIDIAPVHSCCPSPRKHTSHMNQQAWTILPPAYSTLATSFWASWLDGEWNIIPTMRGCRRTCSCEQMVTFSRLRSPHIDVREGCLRHVRIIFSAAIHKTTSSRRV